MKEKLLAIIEKHNKLSEQMADPDIYNNQEKLAEIAKEHSSIENVVITGKKFLSVIDQINEATSIIKEDDEELKEIAQEELLLLTGEKNDLEEELKILLLPKDPNDNKNLILEIRAGTGGDEAALFAADLFRIYTRYAERKNWVYKVMNSSDTGIGGFKEAILSIAGKGAFGMLKYESGVHRVQRVPKTETSGRVHTSAATIAVLPEAEDVDIQVNDADLKIDTYRASGAGGQHVNRTDSAVRLTHLPTNTVVQCQSERSQHQNKDNAYKQLRAKLYELELQQRRLEQQEIEDSKADIGWGSQIRSYVLDQSRVKDLRTHVESSNPSQVLDGELDSFIEASLKASL